METNAKTDGPAWPTDDGATSDTPVMGVLTRTIFRSPVTKLILPARIRHKDKNDVVFVQERSIEIKEYSRGSLRHVTVKDDFGATIKSAGVIGDRRKPIAKVEVKTEEEDESARDAILRQGSARKEPSPESMETDDIPHLPEMPPQILVVALQAGLDDSLVFLCAFPNMQDGPRYLSYQRPLPASTRGHSRRLGKHIAVDPR